MNGKLPNLPASNDEYWESAEVNHFTPQKIAICDTHTKEKYKEGAYKDNEDGTMTCTKCPWGGLIPPGHALVAGKLLVMKPLMPESL